MNHTELIPTIFPNGLPDEFVSIKQELDSLSGDALDTSLKHWEALLLSDTTDTSLILSVFLEVCHRVTSSTPSKDCLLLLDFLSQIKQALLSRNIFHYGKHIYNCYLEEIYSLFGCCSYYFKDTLLQKYVPGKAEHYQQVRAILEEHYQNEMSKWLDVDLENRVGYTPSIEEIEYLRDQAQKFIRTDGNIDQALFYQYRAILLSLKRCDVSHQSVLLQEYAILLDCINYMVSTFQISSDPIHALEMLAYAQKISDQVLTKWSAYDQSISPQNPETWTDSFIETIPAVYFETLCILLRKTGDIKSELCDSESNISHEDVLASYQKALSLSEAIYGSDSPRADEIRGEIALFNASFDGEEKIHVLLQQLEEAKQSEDLDDIESMHGLISEAYEDLGNFEQAIVHWQKKVDILVEIYGDDSDVAADYYNMFGELYERAKKYPEASACYTHALENYRGYLLRTQEEDSDDAESILSNYEECLYQVGRMHLNSGEYEQALSNFQEALEIYDSRNEYSGIERAHYMSALAQTYEKISLTGKAVHYYLFAWDTYHTVAEFNKVRERNVSLFASETVECEKCEQQVQRHLTELGYDQLFRSFEEIDYPSLTQEEQTYFLNRFAQLVRRRLEKMELREKWIILWCIYFRLCTDWGEWTNTKVHGAISDALNILQDYLRENVDEEELAAFSKCYWEYVNANMPVDDAFDLDDDQFDIDDDDEEDEFDIDDEDALNEFDLDDDEEEDDEFDMDDEEEDDDESDMDDEEEQVLRWNTMYLPFYSAIADFLKDISEAEVDFNSLQTLICDRLPLYAEVFTTVYHKDEPYTPYEQQLRYKQVVSSPTFAGCIATIQEIIKFRQ
ncbi:MAG: tetratricopeptide repeat protein [Lachnospiraceae bacterium]